MPKTVPVSIKATFPEQSESAKPMVDNTPISEFVMSAGEQEQPVLEPNLQAAEELALFNRRYRDRLTALSLIRQLNKLLSTVQRHRGVSMALLSGAAGDMVGASDSGLLIEDLQQLQREVERRLQFLIETCTGCDYLLPRVERERMLHAWSTIRDGWQDDALLDNFELHSHFIEQLLQLMAGFVRAIQPPLANRAPLINDASINAAPANQVPTPREQSEGALAPQAAEQLRLQVFICRKIPEIVEQFAKIRGLATHCAVVGTAVKDENQKLRFWLQCARDLNVEMLDTIAAIPLPVRRELASLADLKSYEFKLMFFLNSIERDVLGKEQIAASAADIFALGSEIIDAYVAGVRDGIVLLQRWLDVELEQWLEDC